MSIIEDKSPSLIKDGNGKLKWTTISILLFIEAFCATVGIFIARYVTSGDVTSSLIMALVSAVIIVSIDCISLVLTGRPILSYILPKRGIAPKI